MITLWCRLNLDPFGTLGRVIVVEDWAEIRRLYSGEGLPIKEIVRRLGISRNTVRAALRADRPPGYQRPPAGALGFAGTAVGGGLGWVRPREYRRPPAGSLVDAFEPQIRVLLAEFPRMPATVIAERVGWQHSASIFRARVSALRPEYQGVDPVQKTS